MEGAQMYGIQTYLFAEDERACPKRGVASAVCTVTCTDWSPRDMGHKMALSPALEVRALLGRHLSSGGEGARMSGAPKGVCPRSCVSSAVQLAHPSQSVSYLCRLVSE